MLLRSQDKGNRDRSNVHNAKLDLQFLEDPGFIKCFSTVSDWPNPFRRGEGTGKFRPQVAKPRVVGILNSSPVTKGTSQFPTHGLAGVMER